tara:strand:+ start:1387 stop:1644 length:258 start_codon:yes stop_codon:yes gene_type:complete
VRAYLLKIWQKDQSKRFNLREFECTFFDGTVFRAAKKNWMTGVHSSDIVSNERVFGGALVLATNPPMHRFILCAYPLSGRWSGCL